MDDVGEQATKAHTALIILSHEKNLYVSSEEVFPSIARGLLTNIALYSLDLHHHFYFQLFFSEKSPLWFRGAFFYSFSRKEFRPHSPSRLFFFSTRAAYLARRAGAQGVVVGLK
jgi:hypothetical protein